jgi:hypothetical protein
MNVENALAAARQLARARISTPWLSPLRVDEAMTTPIAIVKNWTADLRKSASPARRRAKRFLREIRVQSHLERAEIGEGFFDHRPAARLLSAIGM